MYSIVGFTPLYITEYIVPVSSVAASHRGSAQMASAYYKRGLDHCPSLDEAAVRCKRRAYRDKRAEGNRTSDADAHDHVEVRRVGADFGAGDFGSLEVRNRSVQGAGRTVVGYGRS